VADLVFYFDLGSPYVYLAAERLPALTPDEIAWQPISLGGLYKLTGRSSWGVAGDEPRRSGIEEVERRAARYGLPRVAWPDGWPSHYLMLQRAALYAQHQGAGQRFMLRAARDAFQRGIDLADAEAVLDVAAAVELDRDAVVAATQDPAIKQGLIDVTDYAFAHGVIGVPTLAVNGTPFWGDDRIEAALEHAAAA
jgi:2-hydroxychromene-2-carboxylate isomerase